jgi:LacI family transcriptional regulator
MPVTIHDVARHLNLSITTVSRALDGYEDVSEETRQRVIKAARELGYSPNRAARQLRRQRADTIGYILPSSTPRFSDPFFSEFIAGLADEAAQNSYDLLVSAAPAGQESEQQAYQRWVRGHKVDGFVLNRVWQSDWRVRYLAEQRIPFASLERSLDPADYPSIQVESKDSVVALVGHLVSQEFRRIAFIGGPSDLTIHANRFEGYCLGLAVNGLSFDPAMVTEADLTSSGGYQAAKRMLWIPDPPDAIICINDETAFGVLHAAHEAHRAVGDDFAVAGFDGVQDSKYTQPPLTTLDQPVYDIARQLVRMLLAEIAGQPVPERHLVLQPLLLTRESTGGVSSSN